MSTDNVTDIERTETWCYAGRRWNGKATTHAYVTPGDWTTERWYSKRLGTGRKQGRDVIGAYYTGKVHGASSVTLPWQYDGLISSRVPEEKLVEWTAKDRTASTSESLERSRSDDAKKDAVTDALTPLRDAYRAIPSMQWSARAAFLAQVIEFLTR